MAVKNIMSPHPVTVEMDDKLSVAKEIFDNIGFHHLLVVNQDKLCGVVSDRDILRAISPFIGLASEKNRDVATLNRRIHQVMTRKLVTIDPSASIAHAVTLFNQHKVSCLPVVSQDGQVVGIVTWRDVLIELERQIKRKGF
ncbi:CBS domain-containing protein [Saccharobesus litoralis]|uniref:CBS domain-containing protein n=1 Tax=Saccharobesus litoralis TaxID=2172099 RepID=A0A2S0VWN3_9ALTE|nr:CBS domain-containing protein [Saccharobesus litoralis]AWB68510.1 CBS domain-containing protein [Saccharobesus litoralis]